MSRMSLRRMVGRLAQSRPCAVQSATLHHARTQLCPRCFQQLQRSKQPPQLHQRALATAAVHRPNPLGSEPPPPRNAGVPDTSITVEDIAADAARQPPQNESRNTPEKWPSNASVPEGQAQQPRESIQPPPTGGASTAKGMLAADDATTPSSKPKRKSKLRPRKAAMHLTPKAVEQLRALLEQPDPKLIRVGVKNKGCSGLAYHLEYVEKAGAFDEAVEQDGVKVLIDSKALFSIIGSEMDWTEDKLSAKFVFKNPNITEQCGCGESFSITA